MCIYIYICICVYIYIYIYKHIHIHINGCKKLCRVLGAPTPEMRKAPAHDCQRPGWTQFLWRFTRDLSWGGSICLNWIELSVMRFNEPLGIIWKLEMYLSSNWQKRFMIVHWIGGYPSPIKMGKKVENAEMNSASQIVEIDQERWGSDWSSRDLMTNVWSWNDVFLLIWKWVSHLRPREFLCILQVEPLFTSFNSATLLWPLHHRLIDRF